MKTVVTKYHTKSFWITLSLINLAVVALYGFVLRTKLVLPLYFVDYRHFMSAHSHFAFGGWVGLSLITLLIFTLLPGEVAKKKIYFWILAGTEISSVGMAVFFPIFGYAVISIIFSSLYIVFNYIFGYVFIKDIIKLALHKTLKLVSVSAILSLLVSAIGPLGLVYILISRSANSILYRDSIYTFLHFQYNGFFSLSVLAVFLATLIGKGYQPGKALQRFFVFQIWSIIPTVFLSLLWHGNTFYYVLSVIGCLLLLVSLYYFIISVRPSLIQQAFSFPFARLLVMLAFVSFLLKMLLNVGMLELHHAIYSNRPVIIGFLHLVFLAFVSFYILGSLIQENYFTKNGRVIRLPFYVFGAGVFANEFILGLQGLTILFKSNSIIYGWLLWGASILLFTGAVLIMATRLSIKKATE